MTKMFTIAFVLGLAACSKSGSGSASGDPCVEPIGKAIDAMLSSLKGPPEAMEQMKAIGEKLRGVMISSCQTDKWSAEVLSCFSAATDQPSIKKCRGKLSAEQAQHLQAEINKVMTGGMGGPGGGMGGPHGGGMGGPHGGGMGGPHGGMAPPPGGEPPPPAGSAPPTGSAAPAGSAAP